MKIAAKEFGIWDLTNTGEIDRFLEKIQPIDNTEITVDVSACLISYDTAEFIDKVLKKIHDNGKPIKLIIHTDFRFLTEDNLYDFLFQKSFILNNHNKNDYTENIKDTILQKINDDFGIEFKVEMPDE